MNNPAADRPSGPPPLLITNARILDPASGTDMTGSLLVEKNTIADLVEGPPPGTPAGATPIDASGMLLSPGLVDTRVFTGEPGHEYRETLASAARAAASGGITTFVVMPDTSPVIDDAALVNFIVQRAATDACVNVLPSAAISRAIQAEQISEFGLLREAGAVCLSEGRRAIQSSALLKQAFTYAASFSMPVFHTPDDESLRGSGVMHAALFATTLGLKGIPTVAETIPLARDLQLAELTGVTYHAAQLSCARSVDMLARAKAETSGISAGVSINNLTLNELDVGQYRTFFKLSPPLRAEEDRLALIDGLASGIIDTIHSDHDPQDVEVKRRPFAEAASGAIGLETLFAAALRLVHAGQIGLSDLLARMTVNPARILGLEVGRLATGAPADFFLADLDYPWVAHERDILSRSRNTTFEGARFTGKVMATWVGGKPVFVHPDAPAPLQKGTRP